MRTKSIKGGRIENKAMEMFIFKKSSNEVFGTYYIRRRIETRSEVNGSH
jgi:hypothetical protein